MGLAVEQNCPLILMNHLPKLLKTTIQDSTVVKKNNCSRTKATKMVHMLKNEAEGFLISHLKNTYFFLIVNETTNISLKKCLAVLARFVNANQSAIKDQLLANVS